MNFQYLMWAFVLIASLSGDALLIKKLAALNWLSSEVLLFKGLICFLVIFIFAKGTKRSLWPQNLRRQFFRGLLAGLSLSLYTYAFRWLSAGGVSFLMSLDIPALVLIVAITKREFKLTHLKVGMSIIGVLISLLFVFTFEKGNMVWAGVLFSTSAALSLCIGYLLVQKSIESENIFVTISTPALSLIFYGFIWEMIFERPSDRFILFTQPENLKLNLLCIVLISFCMMISYFATVKLYKLVDITLAEWPTLLYSMLVPVLESAFLGAPFSLTYFLAISLMTFWMGFLFLFSTRRI